MDAMNTSPDIARWVRRYQSALRTYLGQGPRASLRVALGLGREAAALGLETLDVARIHEQALKKLVLPNGTARTRQRIISRTKAFFEETLVPIEQTRAAAKADVRHVEQLGEALRERTAESSASTRRLKRGVVRRKAAETALEKSGTHRSKLLETSHRLEDRLQDQTRKMLAAQEGAGGIQPPAPERGRPDPAGHPRAAVDVERGDQGQHEKPEERDCRNAESGEKIGADDQAVGE